MLGILKLVLVQDVGAPVANVRVHGTDPGGQEKGIILEYELQVNFNLQSKLSSTFSAIQIRNEEFIGFLFENESDRNAWDQGIGEIHKKLTLTKQELSNL